MNKNFSDKETQWWKKFSKLDFMIEYRSKKLNFANDFSRWFDYVLKKITNSSLKKHLNNVNIFENTRLHFKIKFSYINKYALLFIDNTNEFRPDQKNNQQIENKMSANDKKPAELNNKIDEKSKNNFTNIKILQKSIISTRISNVFAVICMFSTSNNGVSDLKRVQNDEKIKLISHL